MDGWSVVPFLPGRRDTLLALFDACLGSPDAGDRACGACCCARFVLAPALDAEALDAAANRVALASRAEVGELDGYLALDGDTAIGWLNVQSRHRVPHAFARLDAEPPPLGDIAPHDAAIALCLVVAPQHDAEQVARALIAGALDALRARGFRCVDACPRRAEVALLPHEPGPAAWYTRAGFATVAQRGERIALRRVLA
jgi:GNAT superfamily N-acetyltransferase